MKQETYDFDLFVIGAGSGGVRASRIAAGHGARVAVCEESRVGGTCVIRGCVPKKLLVYASQFSEAFDDAAGNGWQLGERQFSWPELIATKDREIDRLNGIYHQLLDRAGVELIEGRGRLAGPNAVEVNGQRYTAEKILIATGGRPWVPEIPGRELGIISDEAFHLPELPERVLIVGAGYVAVEFAGIFNGLGSQVTLACRRELILRGFDADLRRAVDAGMRGRGVDLRYGLQLASLEKASDGIAVQFDDGSRQHFDCVMFATGRSPYSWELGLETVGLTTGERGQIEVDAYNRTRVPGIFAVGDITDRINLTPVALLEGHSFADTQFGGMDRPVDYENVPAAIFSQPAAAAVGLSEEEARARHGAVRIFRSSFRPMKYSLSGRDEKCMMKLVVSAADDRVVGCHIVGPDAAEILQGFAVAVRAGLTKAEFDRTVGIHPTSAEELVTLREPVSD